MLVVFFGGGDDVHVQTENSPKGGGAEREHALMPHRVSCPAFVGRTDELDVLDTTLGRVVAGRAAAVLVGGDAGIGKTRLVDELGQRARAMGATGRLFALQHFSPAAAAARYADIYRALVLG